MAIRLYSIRPKSVVFNVEDVQKRVDFIVESSELEPVKGSSPGLYAWLKKKWTQPNRPPRTLTIALTAEGFGHRASASQDPGSVSDLNREQFSDYCDLIRELIHDAVPRMHAYGDIPEREACVDELPVPQSLKMIHARVIWTEREKIALCYAANYGYVFSEWANTYHKDSNFPAACKALSSEVVVVVPKFWIMTPQLKEALVTARGFRYRF